MKTELNNHYDVIVIGGGITGAGTARDCAMRGLKVLLVERHDYSTGATGRNHGLLHSGARYAVTDHESATECIKENMILLSVTEENGERLLGDRQMFRCDNLTLLQNYDRMYQVGRGYGDLCKDGAWRHIHVPFCSYGSPPELPEGFLERENPFTV